MAVGDLVQYSGANKAYLIAPATLTTYVTGGYLQFTETTAVVGHPALDTPLVFDFANKVYDEDFDGMLDTYLRNVDVEPAEFVAEDGTKITKTNLPSTAVPIILLHYSPLTNGKYAVTAGVGVLSGDTGNIDYANKALGNAPVQWTSVKVATTYAIPQTVIAALAPDTTITAATVTIAANSYGVRTWVS
jgi:hypothetical protein